MAALSFNRTTKTFSDGNDEIVAVDELDLEIRDGEFLVLVGPSGCGKSTTLRMVAGLESPTGGTIVLGDREIQHLTPQERDIAMVFQSYALYPHMSVRGNMAYGLQKSTDLSDDEIDNRVRTAADTLDIVDLLDRKPGELSGGQQQRVALGRAIVRDPEVFLLDEPLANLDAKLRAQMRTELQQLQDELGTTTIYVTHDQTEAMSMSDRIAILNAGELQQVGTPLECYHQPENVFVAGFIGEPSMNFFDVTVADDRLVGDGFEVSLSEESRESVSGTEELVLGIRPEDVVITESTDEPDAFEASINVVEPYGDENAVHMQFADTTNDTDFVASIEGMRRLKEGETVGVSFPEESIHLFDAESGEALRNRRLEDEAHIENPEAV
ncbi:ABC transporter ATP-binding protein [Saliphagus sp. LR7]|uniref:ABC transporter ATP-binding protein n=1 Tax=Saliphagus sp. LR7 TaxID=2282654 RepID=UPI000DF79677|nr:sn-glycerol-3-phosphate ABC transporter ATP-binding protein UgpC [Saliphagus sp. LR7]